MIQTTLALFVAYAGAAGDAAPRSQAYNRTWAAVCQKESHGDPNACARGEDAVGITQIRPVMVKECNRIARLLGLKARWTLDDRWNPAKSREMYDVYLAYWSARYQARTGKVAGPEIWCKMWNGGPDGWRKSSWIFEAVGDGGGCRRMSQIMGHVFPTTSSVPLAG